MSQVVGAPVLKRAALRYRLPSSDGHANWKTQSRSEQSMIAIDDAQTRQGILTGVVDQLEQLTGRWLERHPTHLAVLVDVPVYVKRTSRREVRITLQVFEEAEPT